MNSPSTKQVSELLHTDHFDAAAEAEPSSAGEPVAVSHIKLNLDQIHEFDKNPRRAPNAEYDLLKASLLKTGAVNVLLVVTRRPGESDYFPAAGGNTRLRILKELYAELKDDKYYWINCKFTPYQGEVALMVDHLSENDNRAEYIFIDRARALNDLYEQLKQETGNRLSQRMFIKQLMDMGYSKLSQTQFIRYQFATNLYDYIPQALDHGMGQRALDRLQEFRSTLKAFFVTACKSDPEVIERLESVFHVTLSEHDSEEGIDHDNVANALFALLAPSLEQYAPNKSPGEITALLGELWAKYQRNTGFSVSLENQSVSPVPHYRPERPGTLHEYTEAEINDLGHDLNGEADSDPLADAGSASSDGSQLEKPGQQHSGHADEDRQQHLNLLSIAHGHAKSLAAAYQLEHLVETFGKPRGYGFWIDLPDESQTLTGAKASAWWWLFELSAIAQALVKDAKLVYPDPKFGASRFAKMYRDVEEGRGGIDSEELDQMSVNRRHEAVYCQALRVIENQISRYHDHVKFLTDVPNSQYVALTGLVHAYRNINRHISSG